MITLHTPWNSAIIAQFVLASVLEYPFIGDDDGRLTCWLRGEGTWVVACLDGQLAGIACVVFLDDGPHAGKHCLYWLEVLPQFQRRGVGKALLRWAQSMCSETGLIIASVPKAVEFYRQNLRSSARRVGRHTFLVRSPRMRMKSPSRCARSVAP